MHGSWDLIVNEDCGDYLPDCFGVLNCLCWSSFTILDGVTHRDHTEGDRADVDESPADVAGAECLIVDLFIQKEWQQGYRIHKVTINVQLQRSEANAHIIKHIHCIDEEK